MIDAVQKFSAVKEKVIYLKVLLKKKVGCEDEMKRRVEITKVILILKLNKLWKNHNILKKTKKYVIKILIFPKATTYGLESWTLTDSTIKQMMLKW